MKRLFMNIYRFPDNLGEDDRRILTKKLAETGDPGIRAMQEGHVKRGMEEGFGSR
jgi:hypothetical protein